ncbi:GNAT family N-acetyltransferase [Paenibacillus sp. MWE-103]|uniref:GNAT family N-acetyltransferase n=1 Tax=Paenibacillus artemisiicola TaxID=1172618 RepID=A0ABS3WJ65_9BACL|nr:GNAT family N-acetyltransferase [Paenibacillus artemisiicola]MBO7748136.1 GNAT family N-acetyltransferase [Paenibacillus artemisiicola]
MHDEYMIDCGPIALRPFRPEDLDDFHAITHEPEIVRYLPGWNVPKERRADWLLNYEIPENERFLQAVEEGGPIGELRLRLAIVLKTTGGFIGWACTGMKEELPPPNREIVYGLTAAHRGKGYATMAANGLVRYLFERELAEELNALALNGNEPSRRVIEKCGFREQGGIVIDGETYLHYKRFRREGEA